MIRYIGRRLLLVLLTIFVPLMLVFLLLRLAPGDPAAQILGDQATPDQVAALRHEMGLDQPMAIQFAIWLKHVLTLDLGSSLFFKQRIVDMLPPYALVTIQVALLALLIAIVVGACAGVAAALKRDTWVDRGLVALAVLCLSCPNSGSRCC